MAWFLGIIGVLGFAYLMFVSPKFRDFGCGLIALVILGVGSLWFYSEKQHRDYRAELKRSQEAISASQLQFTDFLITQGSYSWPVEGIVKNNSPHKLRKLTLKVSITVCRNPRIRRTCVVMAEEQVSSYLDIPPGQARRFYGSASITGIEPEANWDWDFSVTSIEADLPRR